ncbi:hypothetical protein [Salisediminibacterium beveridgei]|uniref:Uncharacterized protein n=1 Tax=Salisediminibacterium beveridgei TaxID=632773 RepID=A0A1D7QTQ5_9BACI|nr:hypothetical protein [Salisediminibacterium beveridgei]AOM82348.1 hypothetical protein BBEV_0979 [Salisediminibacterium beveridgei]
MTTVLFFIVGWGLLFVLLLLLPSIFPRKTTAVLALISGITAMLMITAEVWVSWQMALVTGILLIAVFSFLVSRKVAIAEDTEEEAGELYPERVSYQRFERSSQSQQAVRATEPEEAAGHETGTEDARQPDESKSDRRLNRFVVDPEDETAETDPDPSGRSRLIIEDEDATLTERKPLNEDDSVPLKRRDASMDAEEFSEDKTDDGPSEDKK